jgi:hypothetical protein
VRDARRPQQLRTPRRSGGEDEDERRRHPDNGAE